MLALTGAACGADRTDAPDDGADADGDSDGDADSDADSDMIWECALGGWNPPALLSMPSVLPAEALGPAISADDLLLFVPVRFAAESVIRAYARDSTSSPFDDAGSPLDAER
ncbi:MAG: hypothetical protein HYY06_21525 [Deltaproteobacteria bacterium]|nr:hypothetical protein [Deltaproteobacteria bacterium]